MFATVMFVVFLVAIIFASCSPRGVLIPPGSEDLLPCPPRVIPVEELREIGEPGCDLAGSSLVFPDDFVWPISEIGSAASFERVAQEKVLGVKYSMTNWGVPGVGVTRTLSGQETEFWASTDEALDLQKKAQQLD